MPLNYLLLFLTICGIVSFAFRQSKTSPDSFTLLMYFPTQRLLPCTLINPLHE